MKISCINISLNIEFYPKSSLLKLNANNLTTRQKKFFPTFPGHKQCNGEEERQGPVDLDMILDNHDEISKFQRKHEQTLATITADLVLLSGMVDSHGQSKQTKKTAASPLGPE